MILQAFLLIISLGLPAVAQEFESPPVGVLIKEIFISPHPQDDSIGELLEFEAGDPFSPESLRASIKNIYRLGIHSDVRALWRHVDGGIRISLRLEEIPVVEGITILGNGPISRRRIVNAALLDRNLRFGEDREQIINSQLGALYRRQGYHAADIKLYAMVNLETDGIRLEISIDPGSPTLVGSVRYTGFPAFSKADLDSRLLHLAEGSTFRDENILEEQKNLLDFYIAEKYLTASVTFAKPRYNDESNSVDLEIEINAGPKIETVFQPETRGQERFAELIPFGDRNVPLESILLNGRRSISLALHGEGYPEPEVEIDYEIDLETATVLVYVTINEGSSYKVEKLTIDGLTPALLKRVTPRLNLSRKGWFSHPVYSRTRLQEDRERILHILRDQGYSYARAVDTDILFDPEDKRVRLRLEFDTGPRVRIGGISFTGNRDAEDSELLSVSGLKSGAYLTQEALDTSVRNLQDWFDRRGYVNARVSISNQLNESAVDLRFEIDEGEKAVVRKLIIAGNERTKESVIRNAMTFEEGDPYSRLQTNASRRALYRLGIFSRVQIFGVDEELARNDRRVVIRLNEISPYSLLYGIGLDSEEKFRFSFGFSNSNVLGRNVELGFNTRVSQLQQSYQFSFRSPRLLRGVLDNYLRLFYEELNRPGFNARRKGLLLESAGFRWRDWRIIGRFQYKWIDNFNVSEGVFINRTERDIRLSTFSSILTNDSRNDLLDTSAGTLTSLILQYAPEFLGGDVGFVKGQLLHYRFNNELLPGILLAAAFRLGLAVTNGVNQIPVSERFFLGGSNTLRGFSLDAVGPSGVDGSGDIVPLGGNAMLGGNLELRFPLFADIGGTVFYDFGNVFALVDDISLADLEHAIGLGLRLGTPLGPIRLDYGWSLRTDDSAFYFTVGHAF